MGKSRRRPRRHVPGSILAKCARAAEKRQDVAVELAVKSGSHFDRGKFNAEGAGPGKDIGHKEISAMKYHLDKYLHCKAGDLEGQRLHWRESAKYAAILEQLRPGGDYGRIPTYVVDGIAPAGLRMQDIVRLGLSEKKNDCYYSPHPLPSSIFNIPQSEHCKFLPAAGAPILEAISNGLYKGVETTIDCVGHLPTNKEAIDALRDEGAIIGIHATFKDIPYVFCEAHRWTFMSFMRVTMCDQGMWFVSFKHAITGKVCVRVPPHGKHSNSRGRYLCVNCSGTQSTVHEAMRFSFYGDTTKGWRLQVVTDDHVNGNRYDNHWSNLRPVCNQINNWNRH